MNFLQNRPAAPVKCQKGPCLKFFGKKDHLAVAARLVRRHVERAAWANDGKGVPPSPKPTCLVAGDAIAGR
jgi:hypothetical protein